MRGRLPVPTTLMLMRGNPSKKGVNHREPKPTAAADVPKCPAMLKGEARKEWNRLAPELFALGMLTELDLGMLEACCQSWGWWKEYEQLCVKVGPEAAIKLRYRKAADDAFQRYVRSASEFGLSPSQRSRVKVPLIKGKAGPQQPSNKSRFFGD